MGGFVSQLMAAYTSSGSVFIVCADICAAVCSAAICSAACTVSSAVLAAGFSLWLVCCGEMVSGCFVVPFAVCASFASFAACGFTSPKRFFCTGVVFPFRWGLFFFFMPCCASLRSACVNPNRSYSVSRGAVIGSASSFSFFTSVVVKANNPPSTGIAVFSFSLSLSSVTGIVPVIAAVSAVISSGNRSSFAGTVFSGAVRSCIFSVCGTAVFLCLIISAR